MYKYTLAVTSPEYWNTIHNALIVAAEPALAVNVPERLVVIPTFAFTPVKLEPSPTKEVAVIIPALPR